MPAVAVCDRLQSPDLSQRLNPYAYDACVAACALNPRPPFLALVRKLVTAFRNRSDKRRMTG